MDTKTSQPASANFYLEDLSVGQTVERKHIITDDQIQAFARLTGDYSPLHVDDEFASTSRFGRRLAHGMLTASFITEIIGMKLPARNGIYMGQTLSFMKPVFIGDEVLYRATITHLDSEKCRIRLQTQCFVDDQLVLDGESLIFVPRRPPAI